MARPLKHNADYFPHLNNLRNDRRCRALRARYGTEGFCHFLMLIEVLTATDHFKIEYTEFELELLAGDFDTESKNLQEEIEYCISLGLIQRNGKHISSPLLSNLKQLLIDYRANDRNRKNLKKTSKSTIFRAENPNKENTTSTDSPTGKVNKGEAFRSESTQSKVKQSKEKQSKGSKAKGGKKQPPLLNDSEEKIVEKDSEKEKSSAKKEKEIILEDACKACFLAEVGVYVWEIKDDTYLKQLLFKIKQAIGGEPPPDQVLESFKFFVQKLPAFWRSRKFTMYNLTQNFNEIINEIRNNHPTATGNTDKFGRHRADELAHRAKTFGRSGTGD